jgi:hypothetical protein
MKLKTVLVPLTMPLLLAACLGGGGGSGGGGGGSSGGQSGPLTLDSTPTDFTSFSDITANSLVEANAASSVNYRADIVGVDVERDGDLSNDGSTLRSLYSDSATVPEAVRLTVNLPADETIVRDFEDPATPLGAGDSADRFAALEINDGGVTDRLSLNVGEDLNYLSFGLWELDLGQPSIDVGGAAWGATTPTMPLAGTATYEGDLIGYNVLAASTTTYVADSTLAADFGAGTVTFSSSNTVNLETGAPAAGFNITPTAGTISGNGFSGSNPQIAADPGAFVGSFGGNFYGPDAAEAGGWFELSNPFTGNDRYFGSFGGAEVVP